METETVDVKQIDEDWPWATKFDNDRVSLLWYMHKSILKRRMVSGSLLKGVV